MGKTHAWLLYGANGYSGQLIAKEAVRRGMPPTLAGRREGAIRPLAERLGLPCRVFALDPSAPERMAGELEPFEGMLLAAGPFSATSAPMVEACLQTGTHYLDITGEIAVLEGLYRRNVEAQQRGCVLLPGVGFDVVPSDCLAVTLKALLPDATSLELAWAGHSSPTRGTATSMLEGLALGGAMRQGGHLCRVPTAWRIRKVPFRDRTRTAVSLPWGDVSSAYYSTGIPSIVVYAALPASAILALRVMRPLVPLLRLKSLHGWLRASIVRHITGPDEQTRRSGRSQLWGRVTDAAGQERSATLETPEAYQLTAITAVECMRRVLAGKVAPGAQTPATAFGADFITSIAGCDLLTS